MKYQGINLAGVLSSEYLSIIRFICLVSQLQTRTVIAYTPGKKTKAAKKSFGIMDWFVRTRKLIVLIILILIYLIYTNQSSTL